MVVAMNAIKNAFKAARKSIELLYEDECTVIEKQKVKDVTTGITSFEEVTVIENQPCKLSFGSMTVTGNEAASTQTQIVKLFIAPELDIKPGSKITIKHKGRTDIYQRSGIPAILNTHQEINLSIFKGFA